MSINNQRMKWWEKYRNKDISQEVSKNTVDLRDLLRAYLLRMLHAKIDELDIDKNIDNIIRKVHENYTEQGIRDFILHFTPELSKQEEVNDDSI